MSNFLIFKAAFNNSATPAIGTYTAEGGNPLFNINASLSPDYYMYAATAENPIKWFVPTAVVTDFEFVCDILTRDSNFGYAPYFTIADSNGVTKLRMESQYSNIRFMSDDTHGQSSSVICLTSPTDIGGYDIFHQFRIRIRKLTDSSSSVEVYANDNLVTSGTSPALITCGKISFLGAAEAFVTGETMGVKNAYVYDLSGGEVIDRGVLSNAFTRFIGWAKGIFALKSDIPTVNDATLTIQQNGVNVQTFTANASTNATANIQCVDLTSAQTIGGDKDFTGTTGTRNVIPATTDTYDLGSSAAQWNNAYIKSLTINGVAVGDILTHNVSEFVGITGNQTIGGIKTFSNDIRISKASPFCNVFSSGYIKGQAPTSNIYAGVRFFDDINSGSTNTITGGFEVEYNRDGYNKSYIVSRNYAGENHKFFTVGLRVPNDDIRSIDFLPSASGIVNLGTSTNKWKTFNGVNPGALSLPSNSYVNVDTTNWVLDGSDVNIFTPASDGWLGIQVTDTVYDQMHYIFVGRNDSASYYQQNVLSPINALWEGEYHGCVFIPVIKNVRYDIRCICSSIIATFYPCQGNV